jgi:hypothetical protein
MKWSPKVIAERYTHAILSPHSKVVSYHSSEKLAKVSLRLYKKMGCRVVLLSTLLCGQVELSNAHDYWKNGDPVPDWVKSSCCGPADAHLLTPDQVTRSDNFYYVEGYSGRIPVASALPSQDGHYWIFYAQYSNGGQSNAYCFFVPMDF